MTTTGAAYDLWIQRRNGYSRISPEAPSVPSDSIRTAVEARGRAWMAQLQANAPDAIHLDDAGRVHVIAGADSLARQFIAQRLGTPGLSVADRAYTLLTAVTCFADTAHPSRLPVAEHYVTALDNLPDNPAGVFGFRAHAALADAYDGLGDRTRAVQHAFRAYSLVGRLPLVDRGIVYVNQRLYLIVAHALQGTPDGRSRLDSLATALRASINTYLVKSATDSALRFTIPDWQDSLTRIIGSGALIGAPAPDIRAQIWWNMAMPTTESANPTADRAMSLGDGKVRLILFANSRCCIDAMLTVQRMQSQLPVGAGVLLVTETYGHLNGILVAPEDEASKLRTIYLDTLHLTIPIALWVGQKSATVSGGHLPNPSPNKPAYFVSRDIFNGTSQWTLPHLAIVDRRGVVRHIFPATQPFTRDDEHRAIQIVRELAADTSHTAR